MGKIKKTTQDFINESILVHGDKYDYSKVDYTTNKNKVCIICPEHGEFWQAPIKHLKGQGCPQCIKNSKKDLEWFLSSAKKVHGDKYDYSKVQFVNVNTKVCIICPNHGEFWQTPKNHVYHKENCPECAKSISADKRTKTTAEFIKKAKEIHGDKYDYSLVKYTNSSEKVQILCPKHGMFEQNASSHLSGCGCPKCANSKIWDTRGRFTTDDFIKKAKEIHGDKYDYSDSVFTKFKNYVNIRCYQHGLFKQTPEHHIYGACGCPQCSPTFKGDTQSFIKRAKEIHGDKYDYSKVDYQTAAKKVTIICPIHGEFHQTPNGHLGGQGCPLCAHLISKSEQEIADFIEQYMPIVRNDRTILSNKKELDIYIPSLQIAIEYNGMVWHSEQFNRNKYHLLDKLNECNEKGIKLINIFEYEYLTKKEIVLNKLKHIIGINKNKPKIYARKCYIEYIDANKAKDFLNKNHIQGFVSSTVYLGCYYEGDLIGVMLFKRKTSQSNEWELTRFATDNNFICCGVGGKLLKHFIKEFDPQLIVSFADRRWTTDIDNNLYTKLGFIKDKILPPDYHYTNSQRTYLHKFGFRKQILNKKYGLPLTMTEKEMTEYLGYYKIWNCGLIRYTYKKRY